MGHLTQRARERWTQLSMGGRLWWTGASALGLAAVLVLGATTLSDADTHTNTHTPTANAPASGSIGGSVGSGGNTTMPGMSGMTGSPMPSGSSPGSAAATSAASPICPNVTGTTVMSNGMVMAPVPSGAPTPAEQTAADNLVSATTASLTRYQSLSAATAAGYVPITNPNGREVHYANWQIVKSGDVLDPQHPSSLVYANTVSGPVLLGAMYLGAGPCQPGPDVGGPLTQWHAHDNLCLSASHQVMGTTDSSGNCTTGTHNSSTYFMLHVWVAPSLAATHQFQADLTRADLAPIIRTGQG